MTIEFVGLLVMMLSIFGFASACSAHSFVRFFTILSISCVVLGFGVILTTL